MIIILLGSDTLAQKQYLKTLRNEEKLEIRKISPDEPVPDFSALSEPTLFGSPQAFVIEYRWKELDVEKILEHHADSRAYLVLIEESIDQRKTVNKNFLRDSRVRVKEFEPPTGSGAARWVKQYAKELNLKIEDDAVTALVSALLPDDSSRLPVMQAYNELCKLKSFAGDDVINAYNVRELITPRIAVDTFKLLDAIATKQKPKALSMLEQFFAVPGTDEKTKAIQLTALLADQLRNILLVQDASSRNIPESVVLEKTGWKSGRLFVMNKLARSFTPAQVKQTLAKLENLDMELKSSTMPPQLILDMIITGM